MSGNRIYKLYVKRSNELIGWFTNYDDCLKIIDYYGNIQTKLEVYELIEKYEGDMSKMHNRIIKKGKIDESKFKKYVKIPIVIEAYKTDEEVEIETLEGVMKANKGDWIIKGVKGELYPCKSDVFDLTYSEVKGDKNE